MSAQPIYSDLVSADVSGAGREGGCDGANTSLGCFGTEAARLCSDWHADHPAPTARQACMLGMSAVSVVSTESGESGACRPASR